MTRGAIFNAAFFASSAAGFENVDGGLLVKLFIILSAFAVLINQVRPWIFKTPPDNEKYRHKAECERLCKDNAAAHEKLHGEFNERMAAMSGHSANSRKALYESIRKLSEDVAALKATDENQTQQLIRIDAKIDKLSDKLTDKFLKQ